MFASYKNAHPIMEWDYLGSLRNKKYIGKNRIRKSHFSLIIFIVGWRESRMVGFVPCMQLIQENGGTNVGILYDPHASHEQFWAPSQE